MTRVNYQKEVTPIARILRSERNYLVMLFLGSLVFVYGVYQWFGLWNSSTAVIDTFTTATYRAAEYTYLVTNAGSDDDSTVGHQTGKIQIVHDGTTPLLSEYAVVHTSTVPLITFTVDINSGSVRLRGQSIAANSKVRFARLGLAPL